MVGQTSWLGLWVSALEELFWKSEIFKNEKQRKISDKQKREVRKSKNGNSVFFIFLVAAVVGWTMMREKAGEKEKERKKERKKEIAGEKEKERKI